MSDLPFMPLPPYVRQTDPHSCWAAAMESWLAASPGRTRVDQDLLYIEMHGIKGALTDDGMLTKAGIKALSMEYKLGGKSLPNKDLKKLTGKFLWERLTKKGYLWMAYDYYGLPGHVVVVYGMLDKQVVLAMDPMDTQAFTSYPLEDYKYGARQFYIAWSL